MAAAAPAAIPPPPCTQSESQSQSHSKPKRRRRRETTITTTATGFEPRTTPINATTSYDNSTATKVRRAPQAVTTEGAWCCVAKPISSPSPPPPRRTNSSSSKSREQPQSEETARPTEAEEPRVAEPNKENQRTAAENTAQKPNTNGETKCERSKSGDILKSGEIAALIKQGFIPDKNVSINGNGNTSPFRIRLSPGRVSPIMDSASFSSLGYPPGYGKFNSVLNAGLLNPSSSPPVEKIRSSPTLFEMMAHEQEMLPKQHPIPTTNSATNAPQIFHCQSNGKQPSVQDKQLLIQERMSTILSCCSLNNQFNDVDSNNVKLTLSSKDGLSITMNIHRFWWLTVSAAIVFDAGMLSCLEYLEAVPWAEEEEEKVASLLMQLQLDSIGAGEVLKRISIEDTNTGGSEEVLVKLLQLVLKGTDEKARKEMKALVSRMLRENAAQCKDSFDVSKESLYHACHDCLDSLLHHFMQATSTDIMGRASEDRGSIVNQIARQSDNLHWLLDILIDRQIADDFVRMWANQAELAALHSKIPTMYRYEVSRLTARLCIALGRGQVLVPKDVRFSLLQTWLQPMFDDFGWMRRACKALDRKVVEDGISQTILTLPLKQQQNILLSWFDRFLNNGDDCPNLQRAFEVWWRRTFIRPYVEEEQNQLQLVPYNLM